MAEVFVAHREGARGFAKRVALKRILPGLAADPRFVEMFCDEARVSAALNHPNIVQVVDFGEVDGELFMAMEFVDGLTVARLLRLAAGRKEPLSVAAALFVIHEVLRGLEYAHEARSEEGRPLRLVHRDVSPGNILLGRAGEVKLSDFGIVRSEVVARRTMPGELKGKMGYMSPEQVIGIEVDARSDLFTVGIVLTELLLLRPLFPGKNELEILTRISQVDLRNLEKYGAGIPPSVREVIGRALRRDRDQRFASAGQFAEAIMRAARSEGLAWGPGQLATWLQNSGFLSGAEQPSKRRTPSGALRHPPSTARPGSGERPAVRRSPTGTSQVALQASSGTPLGIVSAQEVLSLAATGRLPRDGRAKVGAAEFRKLTEFPVVVSLWNRGAYDFRPVPAERASWTTRIDGRHLAAHLYQAMRSGASGVLTVRKGESARRVFFERGALDFVSSTDPEELLGRMLVARGVLSDEELDSCLMEGAQTGRRLGDVLVSRGRLRGSVLSRVLQEQRSQRLSSMLAWSSASLEFVERATSGETLQPGAPRGLDLVTHAARKGLTDEQVAQALSKIRDACIVPTDLGIDPTALGLTAPELRALRLVLPGGAAPDMTPRKMVDMARSERLSRGREALFALFVALSAGVVVIPGWRSAQQGASD